MSVTPRRARARAKEVEGFVENSCSTSSGVALQMEKKQQSTRALRREGGRGIEKHVRVNAMNLEGASYGKASEVRSLTDHAARNSEALGRDRKSVV